MAHRYRIGDRVVVVAVEFHPDNIGAAGVVTSVLMDPPYGCKKTAPVHTVELPHGDFWCLPSEIEPYRDDSSEKGEWTDELRELCKPRKVTA